MPDDDVLRCARCGHERRHHTTNSEGDLIKPAEVAARLNVSLKTVYRWVAAGKIDHVRLGPRLLRFAPSVVDRLVARKAKGST